MVFKWNLTALSWKGRNYLWHLNLNSQTIMDNLLQENTYYSIICILTCVLCGQLSFPNNRNMRHLFVKSHKHNKQWINAIKTIQKSILQYDRCGFVFRGKGFQKHVFKGHKAKGKILPNKILPSMFLYFQCKGTTMLM